MNINAFLRNSMHLQTYAKLLRRTQALADSADTVTVTPAAVCEMASAAMDVTISLAGMCQARSLSEAVYMSSEEANGVRSTALTLWHACSNTGWELSFG